MNLKRRFKYFVASFLMLASTITPLRNGLVRSVYADEPADAPVRSKTLKDNGDGTYTLTLSVTGKASSSTQNTKANVVVVFDSSGSMDEGTTANRYEERTYGRYGLVDDRYVQLYYRDGGRYREVGTDDWHNTVYYSDESSESGYTRYTETRFDQVAQNRLQVAKSAVNSLGEKLLSYNTTTGVSDMVQMAFIDFASNVKTNTTHTTAPTAPTTSLDTFKSWVNATDAEGGTNWEGALTAANNVSFGDNDPVYIVFVSDGNPTFRLTSHGNNDDEYYRWGGRTYKYDDIPNGVHGNGRNDNLGYNFADAQAAAAAITGNSNKTLYAVGVFGDASNMQNLNSKAIYKDATDQAALNAAFDDIVKSITNSLSLTGLVFNDGITGMTSVVVGGTAGGFTYTKGGNNWADAPAAKFENGTVTWDLGNTVLADGETATVSFIVYPSQESLDLIADLNNGKVSYDGLSADQKSQIIKNDNKYTLKTNTDNPTLTYKTVTTTTVDGQSTTIVSDPKTVPITNPDPVDLYQEEAELQKLWEDSLDPSQREDEVEDIYLQFYKKDYGKENYEEYDQFHENYDATKGGIKVKKVKDSNEWTSGKISIAPGLMVSEGHAAFEENAPYGVITATINGQTKRYAILNPGHDYKFGESDINNHFELTNYIYHPMLVDGTLMNVMFTKSGDTITGVESAKNMSTISATNTIKGGINITKKVVDEEGREISDSKDKFNISIHLLNADGNSGYDYDYRVYCVEAHDDCNQALSDGSGYRSAHIYGNGTITRDIYATDTIRVVNIDTGTLYYVEENNIPLGYSLDGIDYNIKNYTTEEGQTPQEAADKVAKNIDGKDYYAVAGNSSSSAVITNKYVSGNLEVSKTVKVDSGNVNTAKDKAFTFTFNLYKDNTKTVELKDVAYKLEGVEGKTSIKSGETFTLKDGDVAKISKLPEGSYYEVTEAAADGYATTKTGDTGTIAKNETQKADFTNTYSVSGKVKIEAKKDFNDWRTGDNFKFKLVGDGIGQEMTATIDGADKTAEFEIEINDIGTYEYTISEDLSGVRGGIKQTSGNITAIVTATDDTNGGLEFNVVYRGGNGEKLNTIVNRYSASGKIQLGASKILTGRDWQEGELYTFTLIGPDNNEIDSQDVSKDKTDVVFNEISYTTEDAGKTFVYVIHESTPLPGGVTNSGDITATVTVEDNHNGTLKTTVVYSGGQGEKYNTIVNTYSAEGEFSLEATKELVGRDWLAGEKYDFVLKNEKGEVVDTQTVDANEKISFKAIKFTQADAGEHKYTITETGTLPGGLTKSDDIKVTLTVTDDKKGNLSFVADYSNNGTITNTYEAMGEVQLEATKVLEGRDWRENESFEFELSGDGIRNPETITVTKENPTAKFEKIKYDQADAGKTYVYTIKETTDLTGMSMENSGDITVTVKLADDGEGGIVPEVTYSKEDKIIKNIYSASGDVALSAEKKLEGRDWKDGESYEFALKDADGHVIDTQTISKDGTVTFKKIEYTKIGTYNYTIEETTEMSNGMSNSGAINVSVEVTDNYDGTLTATPTYKDNNKTIVNTYKASGKAQLEATKVLEGRDWKNGESFTFELFKGDESLGRKTVTKDSPKAVFDEIKYTEADIDAEYVYTIKEVGTLPSGVTSSGDLTVYVNISDNGDGTLNVVTDYRNGGTITNTYEANGKAQLEVTKELVGRDWLDSDEFTFELSGEGIETQTKTVKKGAEKAIFDEIQYSEANAGKTYTYTIKETTDLSGLSMTNSGEVTATVKVTDDGEGNLETEVSYTNSGKITNTYTAKGEVELQATKELVGRDWLKGESYDFVLSGKDGEIDRKAVSSDGAVTFKKISYTEADAGKTYTYTISEAGELKKGLAKSDDITVTIKLTDDGKGNITTQVEYTNNGVITNTYKAKGQIALEIEKELVGRDWKDGESYSFDLKDENTTYDSQSIDKNGKVSFKALEYTEADAGKTYNYTITETGTLPSGITNSGDVKVAVSITDNGDGTLKVEAEYGNDGKIVNTYEASGEAKLEATKVIEGRDWLDSDEFTFELSGEGIDTQTKTVKKGQEKAVFDAIKYTEADAGKTYTYTIKETTDLNGLSMTNSGSITATVKVVDNGDGNLATEVSYTNSGKITNTYTAKGEVELQATKELVGRDWLEGESYDFVLSGKDGEIDRQSVDGNETVTFKKINYTEADAGKTYTYTITEAGELEAGITKSGDISVTVKLTDDNKGKISAEVSYTNDGKIVNTYETKPVEVEKPFTVKKKIDDQSNSKKDASFKFELLDDKNAVVQTKEVSTKDLVGSVDFDAIKFDKAGTYKYTLVETNDGQAGFSYDTAKHAVVIEVTDDYEKAQLVAKVTIDGKEVSEVEFVNTYKAEDTSTKINLEKVLSGIDQNLAKEFEFVLSDKDGEIQTVKIKGSGKAEFDEIKFEKVGEYTYTVKEVKGNAKGYTYDESEYTVIINVSDEDAKLKAEISYKKDGAEADAIIFENSYKPEDVIYGCADCKVPIAVKKVLEKRDLKDKEFKFNVYLGGELVATGYNTADGKIVLDKGITLNEAGKYNFVIKEDTAEREQDITYDESEYTFIVEVEDTGEGELKVVSDTSSNITFTNKYNEPGRGNTPPKTPYTYDGIMASVATLAISLVGLIGSLFAGKRYLKKER